MIEGRINDRYEPIISITVTTPEGASREVEAVIDTGFNGFLSLPAELVRNWDSPTFIPAEPSWPTTGR